MNFVAMSEVALSAGQTHAQRYWQVIEEAVLAERCGFDAFAVSEHHFAEVATCSSLESFLTAIAMRTSRIRLRPAVFVLPFAHPVRIAEQIATLDVFSNGRIDFGAGRGNYIAEMQAFEIPASETRARWEESLRIIAKALSQKEFSHDGRYFHIPPRSLVPRPVQNPHPPLWTAATSLEGSYLAGKMGLGEMTFANFLGFRWLTDARGRYLDGLAECEPIGASTTKSFSAFTVAHCAETREQARREAWPGVNIFTSYVVAGGPQLAKASKDYGYMRDYERFARKIRDYDFLVDESAVLCVGNPEDCIAQIRRYQEAGVDEMVLRIDLQPHEQIMRSIEMFGKEVIPKFRHT
jgi:alkanesulfonate monooxygenase SsuD/methylene tetrahydromethanopterin reductase-like flavin-dependent oxidoreductase (luciferase family)